jgi:DNA-binding beta-propeller fold protein YncE
LVGFPVAAAPGTTFVYPPWSHCYGLHRVNQTHLTVRAGFRYKFDEPQGIAALKLAAEDDPDSRRDDDELTVFGVNSGQHFLIYNTSITSIAFYGARGDGVGQFELPTGIAAQRDGAVVVADTGNDRLHVLQYGDDQLRHVRFIAGSFNGRPLRRPAGVALEGGSIYVCDPESDRILVLDLAGNLERELRPERDGLPLLRHPFAIAVIRSDQDTNYFGADFIAVTDSSRQRLVQLDRRGDVLAIRRARDLSQRDGGFDWVAIDYHASVYCSDRGGKLHKFDRNLQPLLSFGRAGNGDYEFDQPRGLGLYRRFGQLFVAERRGAQYLWLGTDVFSPALGELTAVGENRWSASARFFLTEFAQVSLSLVDTEGRELVSLQPSSWTPPGAIVRPVQFTLAPPAGSIRLEVDATPTYSARKIVHVEKHSQPLRFPRRTAP